GAEKTEQEGQNDGRHKGQNGPERCFKRGAEKEREQNGRRDDDEHGHELVGKVFGDVAVDRVYRLQQQGREQPFAHAVIVLPHMPVERQVIHDHHRNVVGGEPGDRVAADRTSLCPGYRRPDDKEDDRLQHRTQQPYDGCHPVLHLHRQTRAVEGLVDGAHRYESGWVKTVSITSSMGGSWMVRSSTSMSARSCPVTRAALALGTRSVTWPGRSSSTSP